MRIPGVQADVGVSGSLPAPRLPAAAFGGGAALAAGIAEAGDEIAKVIHRKNVDASKAEAIFLQSQIELSLQQHDATLKQTETDGDSYLTARRQAYKSVTDQIVGQARQPFTQKILAEHLPHVLTRLDEAALNHASDLTKKASVAQLSNTLDNFDQQLAGTDYRDTQEIARINSLKEAAIQARAPLIGLDKATTLAIAERKKTTEEIAYRHAHDNPNDFIAKADQYRGREGMAGMDGEKLDRLVTGANARIESLKRQEGIDEDRARARLDREIGKARTDSFARLTDSILQGKGLTTTDDIRADPGYQWLTGEQRQHLSEMVTNPKQTPSDPATKDYVLSHLGDRPTIGESEVLDLKRRGKLGDADTSMALTHIQSRRDYFRGLARTDQHRAEDQALAEVNRRQGEVNTLGVNALTVSGMAVEKLDAQQQKYQQAYREAMLKRSKGTGRPLDGFPRNEEPEKVMQDILPPLVTSLRGDVDAAYKRLEAQARKMTYPTPEALFKKFPGDPSQYATNPEYTNALRVFQDMRTARDRHESLGRELERIGVPR